MADEVLRPQKVNVSNSNINEFENLPENHPLRQDSQPSKPQQIKAEDISSIPGVSGNIPPQFLNALNQKKQESNIPQIPASQTITIPKNASVELASLLENLKSQSYVFEEIKLPSGGKFYNSEDGPQDGILHIRPMTGEEEQILATPRFVKKGQAIDMIFQRCIQEPVKTQELLSIDRTFLLIYLRGISYGPDYDVEIKCPDCSSKFATVIDLNNIPVENPSDAGMDLRGKLPKTGFSFTYRMSIGKDENEIQEHREKRVKKFGDQAADDTITFRMAQLVESIENVRDKNEILILIKNLPMQDVSYLRGVVTDPDWGLDTKIPLGCPTCSAEFEIDLPLDTNFFFPRRKKEVTQA